MKIFITSWKKYPKTWKNKNKPRAGLFSYPGPAALFFLSQDEPGRTRTNQDEPGRTKRPKQHNNQPKTKTRTQDGTNGPDDIQGVKASTNPSANKAAQVANFFKLSRRQAHTNNAATNQATAGVIDPPRFIE